MAPSDDRSSTSLAIEALRNGEALLACLTPEGDSDELPNRLIAPGRTSDLKAILDAAERGQKIVASQRLS